MSEPETNPTGKLRPTTVRLAMLERIRQPTVAQLEEREFLREQMAWVDRGGPDETDPPRKLLPLPKD